MSKPQPDDDIGGMWRDYRKDQQERRAARLPARQDEIEALRALGYTVRALTNYQFRVNNRLDLYPIHRRWHDIPTNRRGSYRSETPAAVVARLIGPPTGA